jgi:lysine-specific histone demethylase 1
LDVYITGFFVYQVVLCFERAFWDQSINLFGRLNEAASCRGEMFLFWSIGSADAPTLIALVAGQSADMIEKIPDDTIVKRCMHVLCSIYGAAVPTAVSCIQ